MSKIYIFLLRSDGKQLNINKGLTKVIMILYMQQGRTLRGPLKTLTDLMYSTVVSYIFPRMEEPLQLSWWAPTSSSLLYTISRKILPISRKTQLAGTNLFWEIPPLAPFTAALLISLFQQTL